MRFATISLAVVLTLFGPQARGESIGRNESKLDPFSTKLTEHRARCGFTFHNGTVEYAVTDKDVPSGVVTPRNAPKTVVVGPNSPAVRNVNVAVNITKPLLVSTTPQTASKIEVFQVRRESPAGIDPPTDQAKCSIGGVSFQTSDVVPVTVRSDIKLQDVRIVREMTPADRWNGSVLKPRGSR